MNLNGSTLLSKEHGAHINSALKGNEKKKLFKSFEFPVRHTDIF